MLITEDVPSFARHCRKVSRHMPGEDGGGEGGGLGGTQRSLIRGGSAPRSNPLSFYIPFLTERYLFRIPSIDKWYPLHLTLIKTLCHLSWGVAHCLFWFQWTSCDFLGGKIMASHLEEEMNAAFGILVCLRAKKRPCRIKRFWNPATLSENGKEHFA